MSRNVSIPDSFEIPAPVRMTILPDVQSRMDGPEFRTDGREMRPKAELAVRPGFVKIAA